MLRQSHIWLNNNCRDSYVANQCTLYEGKAIMLMNLSIILFSNSHDFVLFMFTDFTYYSQIFIHVAINVANGYKFSFQLLIYHVANYWLKSKLPFFKIPFILNFTISHNSLYISNHTYMHKEFCYIIAIVPRKTLAFYIWSVVFLLN